MLNNALEEMFRIASNAIFSRLSNNVERLFSRAKKVLPMHFEQQVFQFANKRLWNIKNIDNVVAKIQ